MSMENELIPDIFSRMWPVVKPAIFYLCDLIIASAFIQLAFRLIFRLELRWRRFFGTVFALIGVGIALGNFFRMIVPCW